MTVASPGMREPESDAIVVATISGRISRHSNYASLKMMRKKYGLFFDRKFY